jgi:hypothetical protein
LSYYIDNHAVPNSVKQSNYNIYNVVYMVISQLIYLKDAIVYNNNAIELSDQIILK